MGFDDAFSDEYMVLKQRALQTPGMPAPSVAEMREWLNSLRRRSTDHSSRGIDTSSSGTSDRSRASEQSFKELEERYHLRDVWGTNTTPAMQTLECIQQIKTALTNEAQDDSMSARAFAALVAATLAVAVAIVLAWELYGRPRIHGAAAPM